MGGCFVNTTFPQIVVVGGGTSAERDVSLASSKAVYEALASRRDTLYLDLQEDRLPPKLNPQRHVVFPVLHGTFGEDGGFQLLLEKSGFSYVGCDAASSALCMNKRAVKEIAAKAGIPVAPSHYFTGGMSFSVEAVFEQLGSSEVVVKPVAEGSSVGLEFADSPASLASIVQRTKFGSWMIEPKLCGSDVTVGVLKGEALGVVEILPKGGGPFDYLHKYTPGMTEYRYPAPFEPVLTEALRAAAVTVFEACECRDFARVDFFMTPEGYRLLEINTIPGLTATSLLPKSASCFGYDFPALIDAMISPAIDRYNILHPSCHAQKS